MWSELFNKAKNFLGLGDKTKGGWTASGLFNKAKSFINKSRNFLNNKHSRALIGDINDMVGGQQVNDFYQKTNNRLDDADSIVNRGNVFTKNMKKAYHIGNNIVNGGAMDKNYERYVQQQRNLIHPSKKDRHSSLEKTQRPPPEEIDKDKDYITGIDGNKLYFST